MFFLVWGGNSFVLVVLVEVALGIDFICVVFFSVLEWRFFCSVVSIRVNL